MSKKPVKPAPAKKPAPVAVNKPTSVKKPVAKTGPVNKTSKAPATKTESTQKTKSTNQQTAAAAVVNAQPELSKEEIEKIKKQNEAATRIQTHWRMYDAKKQLKKKKIEKQEYEEKMKKLEEEAYLQMIKFEQEKEEKKRQKILKEKQEKQKQEARRKKFLEAAYEGTLQEMKYIIDELKRDLDSQQNVDQAKKRKLLLNLIESKDPNNNTALSEASAGGAVDVVKFLLSQGADPNSRGAYNRTPLWRAAFSNHLDVAQILLENGADMRLYTNEGQRPAEVATNDSVLELLQNWDIKLTERMLDQMKRTRNEYTEEQIKSLESMAEKAEEEYENAKKEYDLVKNQLLKCNSELARLHDEYLLNEEMYGQLIDVKEKEKVDLIIQHDSLREKMVHARLHYKEVLRDCKKEKKNLLTSNSEGNDDEGDDDDDEENIMKINIREIDEIILRDLSGKLRDSDKWPLIIDQNDQASTFLRYRDTNYISCFDTKNMQPERFRLALLGAIRYGKPFVLDLMEYDEELLESIKAVCNMIDVTLYQSLLDKSILKNEKYLKIVRPNDGPEYDRQNFSDFRIKNFKLMFLTSAAYPCDALINDTLVIRIIVN